MVKPKDLAVPSSFALLTSYSVYYKHTRGLGADGCHIWEAVIALITSATATKNADSADKISKFGWRMESILADQKLKIIPSFILLLQPYTTTEFRKCTLAIRSVYFITGEEPNLLKYTHDQR